MEERACLLLEQKKYFELSQILKDISAPDIASLLEELPKEHQPLAFRLLPKELAADAFVDMDPDLQELLIHAFSDNELKEVLEQLYLDDTVDIIEEMPANVVKRILKNSTPDYRAMINQVLKYPKDSAGSIMTIEYVDLKKDMTVADAFARIRKTGVDKETIYTCYVVGPNRLLLGLVSVRTLLLSDYADRIEDIMQTHIICANTLDDKEEVAKLFDRYDFLAIPVVDTESRLVGIITIDDAIDVLREENSEDFAKMAAINPSDGSYFKTSVLLHAKNRFVWLLILMLAATISGGIISSYQNAFAVIPMLVSFIPMLMATGGNSGTQTSALIIRGMALDEIKLKDYLKVAFKEMRVALLVGLGLCIVNFVRVYIIYGSLSFGLVTGISLICTIFISKLLGCSLPMLAKRLKLDPAVMAAPILTTIADACSIVVYFTVAVTIFNI